MNDSLVNAGADQPGKMEHLEPAIQSFGLLLAIASDWTIQFVSANAETWTGRPPTELFGQSIVNALGGKFVHDVRNQIQLLGGAGDVERLFGIPVVEGGPRCDIAVHRAANGLMIVECEPADTVVPASSLRRMMWRLQQAKTGAQSCDLAVRLLQALTGFDRVAVVRRTPDGQGRVVTATRPGTLPALPDDYDPLLGNAVPADLTGRFLMRVVGDIDDVAVPVGPNGAAENLLDGAVLRAPAPAFCEQAQSLGIKAAMTLPIMVDGGLWGVLEFHHASPRRLALPLRTDAEMLGQVFALLLAARSTSAERGPGGRLA